MSGSENQDFSHIPGIQEMYKDEGLDTPETAPQFTPVYKKMAGSKIPVAKSMGKLWSGRISASKAARDPWRDAWDEALKAYNADQQTHRTPRSGTAANKRRRKDEQWSQTENVIFSAIKAILPAIYARNPVSEFTASDEGNDDQKKWVNALEKLCNTLGNMRNAPGIALKYKVKQAIVSSKLTNMGWVETGYVLKSDSSDQALIDLQQLSQQLEKAKDIREIEDIEGKMIALEEAVNTLAPSGPYVRYYKDVYVDPEAMEPDFSDAKWMAVEDYYPTSYLNAVYGQDREEGTGVVKSVYEPTAVLTAGGNRQADGGSDGSFRLFDTDAAAHYGYKDNETFTKAQRTKCWRIYDKVTRRVLLFADNKWDWPIWVEDDKLELPTFFPFEPLIFNVSPQGPYAFSEVAYVLDQQDAINEINDAERRARMNLEFKVLYDQGSGVRREDVERVLKGTGPAAEPIKVPDGKKIDDMFYTPQPNMLKAPQLYDVQRQRQVVDGILGVTPSLRASEFKTNTTNKAIEQYNSTTSSRLDEQIDEIEEFIGRIYYNVAYLCARFMSKPEVAGLIGPTLAAVWRQVDDPRELATMFTMRVVGGSTTKPTSAFKQQVAIQIGQVLGQFVQAAPGAITKIILKLFEQAYDEVGISQEDWDALDAEVNARLGIEAQSASPDGGAPSGGGPDNPPSGGPPAGPPNPVEQIAAMVDTLPPEAKIALGNAMAKGVPIMQAVQQIMQLAQQPETSPQ